MRRWFTSDSHFGNKAILRFCDRPWATTDEMDKALIWNWNSVVGREDLVYHLGDFSFHKPKETANILRRLNGQIMLIEGNHDKSALAASVKKMFVGTKLRHEISVNKQRVIMSHYAMSTWNKMHGGSLMLHGHSHGTLGTCCSQCGHDPDKKILDVGVDVHNYFPVSWEAVERYMSKKEWVPVDHHGQTQRSFDR